MKTPKFKTGDTIVDTMNKHAIYIIHDIGYLYPSPLLYYKFTAGSHGVCGYIDRYFVLFDTPEGVWYAL